ncbi:hypothetical protein M5C99_11280 [Acidovorax sp. NCPPB 2350]|nr:hypothetical protein M5C99_11280 [Acidovorax sp. NCPPB 2350]
MATPNYGYEKRQRELAKKKKKDEKAQARAQRKSGEGAPDSAQDEDVGGQPGAGAPRAAGEAGNGAD